MHISQLESARRRSNLEKMTAEPGAPDELAFSQLCIAHQPRPWVSIRIQCPCSPTREGNPSITFDVPRARKRGAMRACMRHLTARFAQGVLETGSRQPRTDAAHPALLRTPFTPLPTSKQPLGYRESITAERIVKCMRKPARV